MTTDQWSRVGGMERDNLYKLNIDINQMQHHNQQIRLI